MYYRLKCSISHFECEESFCEFARSFEEANQKAKDIERQCEEHDIYCYSDIQEISFHDLKKEITVSQFEGLFNLKINEPT